ncbi:hypothetical protein GCM10022277_04560 [Litoribacillus peritrichatus]|uniref:Type II secretion system protein H n=2 Tax=Litoribacillus peritrichatus TaxID=718191 RepID=A0ABP7M1K2_9GAMM
MAVTSVLFTVAWSALRNYIPNEDVRQVALQLQTGLLMARSEAVKTSNNVYLTASANGYIDGWAISTNQARTFEDCVTSANSDCVFVYQNDRPISFSGEVAQVVYDRQGRLPLGNNLDVEVCDGDESSYVTKRTVVVNSSGFPKIIAEGDCLP